MQHDLPDEVRQAFVDNGIVSTWDVAGLTLKDLTSLASAPQEVLDCFLRAAQLEVRGRLPDLACHSVQQVFRPGRTAPRRALPPGPPRLPLRGSALRSPPTESLENPVKLARTTEKLGDATAADDDAEQASNLKAAKCLADLWPTISLGNEFEEEMAKLGRPWTDMWARRMASRYEGRYLDTVRRTWHAWTTWLKHAPETKDETPTAPSALALATWLDVIAVQGNSVVKSRMAHMRWMQANMGLRGLPLNSPLVMGPRQIAVAKPRKQAKELPLHAFTQLRLVATGGGSAAFFAQAVLYILTTSLRFRHTQRHAFEHDIATERTIFGMIWKGKTKGRHAFWVSCPTHIAPGQPTFETFRREHSRICPGARFLVPDIEVGKDGAFGLVVPKPMSYVKFTRCLRSLLIGPPAKLTTTEALQVTSYSLRRKLASVADRLGLSIQRRSELGDWKQDVIEDGARIRRAAEPMAVRYSAARLETTASTRRLCLHVLDVVSQQQHEEDAATRALRHGIADAERSIDSDDWGIHMKTHISQKQPSTDQSAKDAPASSSSSSASSATSGGSQASSNASSPSSTASTGISWIVSRTKRTRIHLTKHPQPSSEPACGRPPLGTCLRGRGVRQAQDTGRDWCNDCFRQLSEKDQARVTLAAFSDEQT